MAQRHHICWRTQPFREKVRSKIEELIRQYGNPTTKSVAEIENHVFQKAKSMEEYLASLAHLVTYFREMVKKFKREPELNMAEHPDILWRTQLFRQNTRNKIEQGIIRLGNNPTTKSVAEMEKQVFRKAKSKEEYERFVTHLLINVREMRIEEMVRELFRIPVGMLNEKQKLMKK